MFNKVELIGRTTKTVELTRTKEGRAVGKFTLAVSNDRENKTTSFINCVAFGKTAEAVAKFVLKGDRVAIVGSLKTNSYQAKDGTSKFSTYVQVDEVEFLESKRSSSETLIEEPSSTSASDELATSDEEIDQVSDEDLPF